MSSNENDAMRRNDVLSETNILICYTPKTELRGESYDVMKYAKITGDLGKIQSQPRVTVAPDLDPVGT